MLTREVTGPGPHSETWRVQESRPSLYDFKGPAIICWKPYHFISQGLLITSPWEENGVTGKIRDKTAVAGASGQEPWTHSLSPASLLYSHNGESCSTWWRMGPHFVPGSYCQF